MSISKSNHMHSVKSLTRSLTFTSGKGGVGKSTLVANVAYQLGQLGKRVLILDGDLGMANIDIMFGARPELSIQQVLDGSATLNEILYRVAENVYLIPGGSGIRDLQHLDEGKKRIILEQVNTLNMAFDFMIIDTAPGIADNVLYLNAAAQEIHVVVTPEPSSLADSYALIKVLNSYYDQKKFSIVANQVRDEAEGLSLFRKLSDVADRFLCVSLDFKGAIPADPLVKRATKAQQILVQVAPQSLASQSIVQLSKALCAPRQHEHLKGGIQFFWEQLVGVA